jgi:hypothetical protein
VKNIQDKTKKRLTIAGLGIVCVALVIAISSQFKTETPADGGTAPASAAVGEVNPSADMGGKAAEKEVVIPANEPATAPADNTAPQTDQPVQNLQPEVTKPPEPAESQKTDPTRKPSGEKVDNVQATDHNNVQKPDAPQTGEPKGGERKDGKVYLPGFGWVTETGGSGTTVGNEGDELTGNKVGSMD